MKTDHLKYPVAYGVIFGVGKMCAGVIIIHAILLACGLMTLERPTAFLVAEGVIWCIGVLALITAAILGAITNENTEGRPPQQGQGH